MILSIQIILIGLVVPIEHDVKCDTFPNYTGEGVFFWSRAGLAKRASKRHCPKESKTYQLFQSSIKIAALSG